MPNHLRAVVARLAAGVLMAGLLIVVAHHDRPSPSITTRAARIDVPINPVALPALVASTTTTSTTEPAQLIPPVSIVRSTTTTVASPASEPEPPAPVSGAGGVEDAVHQAFGYGDLFGQAWRVSDCESTHDPSARGGPNYGLFQISSVHADQWADVIGRPMTSSWSDPYANATFARWLYDQQGWGPWACRWAAR